MLVSVIVPTINSSPYLQQCLDSIEAQTFRDMEVILVSDDKREGPSIARNRGLDRAKGQYVCFVDDDDWLEPDAIERLMGHTGDLIVGGYNKVMDGEIKTISPRRGPISHEELREYARAYIKAPWNNETLSSVWGKLFRNKGQRFNPELRVLEDVDFVFRYLPGAIVVGVNEPVYNYRFGRSGSASGTIRFAFWNMVREAYQSIDVFLGGKYKDEVYAGIVSHAILFLVRAGRTDLRNLVSMVNTMLEDQIIREGLKYYHPASGQSHLIPMAMKAELAAAVALLVKYRNHRRYGKR